MDQKMIRNKSYLFFFIFFKIQEKGTWIIIYEYKWDDVSNTNKVKNLKKK